MKRECVLRFGYKDLHGSETWRVVEAIAVQGIHLKAWCLHRTEFRLFHLMRMRGLRIGPEFHDVLIPLPDLDVEPTEPPSD